MARKAVNQPVRPAPRCLPVLILLLTQLWAVHSAHAVIPELIGPLQALWAGVAQAFPLLVGLIAGALGLATWRARFGAGFHRFGRWRTLTAALGTLAVVICGMALAMWFLGGPRDVSSPPGQVPSGPGTLGELNTVAGDWPTFHGNPGRTGCADALPGPRKPLVSWTYVDRDRDLGDFSASPAVVGRRVFFAGATANVFRRTGAVYCLDRHTGGLLWRTPVAQQVFSSPAVVGGRVYVGEGLHEDTGSRLRCLDAGNGAVQWEIETASHVESSPTVADGLVFFGAGEDGLYCADAQTGETLWHLPGYHVDISPAVGDGLVFAGSGYGDLAFFAADVSDGAIAWRREVGQAVWGDPATDGRSVWFGVSNVSFGRSTEAASGRIWCLDARTSAERWSHEVTGGMTAAIVVAGEDLVAASWGGAVICLDPATGRLKWEADVGHAVYGTPVVTARAVYVAVGDGRVVCLDRASGKTVWQLPLKAQHPEARQIIASPALAGGRLYLGTAANLFVCIGDAQ